MRAASVLLLVLAATIALVKAFSPSPSLVKFHVSKRAPKNHVVSSGPPSQYGSASQLGMMDPSTAVDTTMSALSGLESSSLMEFGGQGALVESTSSLFNSIGSSPLLMAFGDQGKNLAGTLFQASLLPYLVFLYFLAFRGNRIPTLGNFGFQFVLLFVLATIPSGVVTKSTYGLSLANVDWLHGGAELLLTVANILLVLGFKEASTNPNPPNPSKGIVAGLSAFGIFLITLAVGPQIFGPHTPFFFGLGDLSQTATQALPWVAHSEPINALSIPTWAIHFSSVFEFLIAMFLVWEFSKATKNQTWKGLTWGMLPLHASGICACTNHFFYNPPELQFLVSMQAALTLLGNCTCAYAAYRIARSNGWTLDEINPFPKSATDPTGIMVDATAALPLQTVDAKESTRTLALNLVASTVAASYFIKYGELGLDLPFTPNAPAALAIVLGIPSITALFYYNESKQGGGVKLPSLSFGDNTLSMDDVKKYGVAGTVAYILTELAFWAVAFPVASAALYKTTGHWPDVINDTTDRAAVIGFIFAGANVARLLVPLRLGAALALAPWVDENIMSRLQEPTTTTTTSEPSETNSSTTPKA